MIKVIIWDTKILERRHLPTAGLALLLQAPAHYTTLPEGQKTNKREKDSENDEKKTGRSSYTKLLNEKERRRRTCDGHFILRSPRKAAYLLLSSGLIFLFVSRMLLSLYQYIGPNLFTLICKQIITTSERTTVNFFSLL